MKKNRGTGVSQWLVRVVILVSFIGNSGCDSGDGGGSSAEADTGTGAAVEADTGTGDAPLEPATCEEVSARLEACGILGPGVFGCSESSAYFACVLACSMVVSCDALTAFNCEQDANPMVAECPRNCFTEVFICDDGEEIPLAYECDFEPDCGDRSDEHADCPVFPCESGDEEIRFDYQCDGAPDCADQSDEHDDCADRLC